MDCVLSFVGHDANHGCPARFELHLHAYVSDLRFRTAAPLVGQLAAKLHAAGIRTEQRIYPGLYHAGTLLALSRPFRDQAPAQLEPW
jgi:hypothetical protein